MAKIDFDDFLCVINFDEEVIIENKNITTLSHCNAQYEIHIPIKGDGFLEVEKRVIPIRCKEAVFIAPGIYHSCDETSQDYKKIVISFLLYDKKSHKQVFYEGIAPFKKISISDFNFELVNRIIAETEKKDVFWKKNVEAMYTILISEVFRDLSFFKSYNIEREMNYLDKRFFLIDDFFEQNLLNDVTEVELAECINLSLRQTSRVLKKYYGMSFREKLCQARMKRAEILLTTTKMPVGMICELVGYNSEPSFFKAFKKYYCMTPNSYRKYNENY